MNAEHHFVCAQCGGRQELDEPCGHCGYEVTLDVRLRRTRDHLRDVEDRLREQRSTRCRFIGVAVGMIAVVLLWFVPGYWSFRNQSFALPLLADQWALMAIIGYGVMTVLERQFAVKRFPFLPESWEEDSFEDGT